MRARLGVVGVAVATLVFVAACSGDGGGTPDADAAPTTASDAPATTEAREVDVTTWVGDDLPLLASPVTVVGDTGVYFAEIDKGLHVVAVDLVAGTERWRRPVHQHGRIQGVSFAPTVDTARQQVVATTYDGERVGLAAFDVTTGEELWLTDTDWAQEAPQPCVDGFHLCVPTQNGEIIRHRPRGGGFVDIVDGGLERTIGGHGDLRLSADPGGGDVELGEIVAEGYETRWRRPLADFVPDASGYGPNGGWQADVDEESGRTLVLVASLPPEDHEDPAAWTESWQKGSLVALADADGSPLLGVVRSGSCGAMPFEAPTFWTCEGISVVEREDFDGDGALDPEPLVGTFTKRSFSDPDDATEIEVDPPVSPFDGILETSDPDLFVLTDPDAGPDRVLDAEEVTVGAIGDAGDLLVGCQVPGEEDGLRVTLRTFDGEEQDYLVMYGSLGLCDLDGEAVDPAEALRRRGELPHWFGIAEAPDDQDPDEDEPSSAVDGHFLWTEGDRVLRAARIT